MERIPLQEYPRPQMRRDYYEILNGLWDVEIKKGTETRYSGSILVPFSPETELSGVKRILQPDEVLHYHRIWKLSARRAGRLLLHFEAVDESCVVYVNGQRAGEHHGGYLAFTLDITELVRFGDNDIDVYVTDPTDTSYHARGKQKLDHGGMFYTPQSGIWQTVWAEWVPEIYIKDLKLEPEVFLENKSEDAEGAEYADGNLYFTVFDNEQAHREGTAMIFEEGIPIRTVVFRTGKRTQVRMKRARLWSPEDPHLYEIHFVVGDDMVSGYFAMRSFMKKPDRNGAARFWLNGRPYFLNGVLDQGYWKESLMTAQNDEALIRDIEAMKDLGFNMLRKHVKIESRRWYWHCDRLGMLVCQDMVNGGGSYNMHLLCEMPNILPFTGRAVKDRFYSFFARKDAEGRKEFTRQLKGMVTQLYNYPCICTWVPFNEGWGQFDSGKIVRMLRKMDSRRLIDQASGWFDQGGGDYKSIHNYFRRLKVRPGKRIIALSEYGGYSCRIEGHSGGNQMKMYRKYKNGDDLTKAYEKLIRRDIIGNLKNGLSLAVCTQLSDVEEEINGFMTWDRKVVKTDPERMRKLNREVYETFEKVTQ